MKNTKEHILNISLNLFMQKNYKEVTLKEIVEETGMSKGAFYHYFESKEQLFIEVINFVYSSVIEIPFHQFNNNSLFEFYHDYMDYFVQEEANKLTANNLSLTFDALKFVPDFQEKLQKSQQAQETAWTSVVQKARAHGEIDSPMNDEEIAKMFIYSIDGFGLHRLFDQSNSNQIKKSIKTLWDSFYKELKV